jgi:hypothetical protein
MSLNVERMTYHSSQVLCLYRSKLIADLRLTKCFILCQQQRARCVILKTFIYIVFSQNTTGTSWTHLIMF